MGDIIETLMDDDTSEVTESRVGEREGEGEKAERKEIRKVRKTGFRTERLSDVELSVLRCLKETKNARVISRMTGYPEIVVSRAVERLIEKGYIDCELNVIRDVPKRRTKPHSKGKLLVIALNNNSSLHLFQNFFRTSSVVQTRYLFHLFSVWQKYRAFLYQPPHVFSLSVYHYSLLEVSLLRRLRRDQLK